MGMDGVLAVSDEDRGALLAASCQSRDITVIPIAVDTDEVAPVDRQADADHLLHIGTMYWPPNIDGITWFLDEIMPTIVQQRPGTVFDMVGRPPAREPVGPGAAGPPPERDRLCR